MADPTVTSVPTRDWLGRTRLILLALSWLILAIYFYSPVRQVMDTSLDASNYASYAYFTAHGFQYGSEVVPMAGPYGFVLYGWTYSGNLFGIRTICELVLNAALATLTLWFFLRSRGSWWRWAWLATHVAFTPFIDDLPIEWTLLLAGLFLVQIQPAKGSALWAPLVAGLLAFLSLIKGTQLILALATLGVVAVGHASRRQWKLLILITGSYLVSLLLFWILAGQNVLHLPAYLRGIGQLAGGYNDAMSLQEPFSVFLRGVLVFTALVLGLIWALWIHRSHFITVASLLLFAAYAFVEWKHGFVRADGHAYIFFHYAMVASLAAYLLGQIAGGYTSRLVKGTSLGLLLATLLASGYNTSEPMLPSLRHAPAQIEERLVENIRQLNNLSTVSSDFARQLSNQSRLHDMPLVRHEVGHQSIDLFGFEHGLLPLNGLNYRPRPMGGGPFNVYTPTLMQLNRDFLRDPARRPNYYLLYIQTLDYRLVTPDDGLVLTDLLYYYQPVLVEHDHLLLKAVPQPAPPHPRLLTRQTVHFGDVVPAPAVDTHEILVARFEITPNLLGRILSALYKLPRVRIGLRGQNIIEPEGRRLVPAMVGSPFILSPVIENNRDWLGLFTERPGKSLSTFRISTSDRTWFSKTIQVEFFALPRPAPSGNISIEELLPFTETATERVSTTLPSGEPIAVIGQLVHAPANLSWRLTGDERSLSFNYGLVPAAYLNGKTDGVEFSAILQRPNQPPLELFRNTLDPIPRPFDRGLHHAEIVLPTLTSGAHVSIITNPGPHNDKSWDWAYLSDLQFKYGKYPANLFPNFNVVPIALDANLNSIIEVDGKQLFMVYAPSALTFALKGNEHTLQIDFGLLPGAYTNGGQTQGVDYVVELIHAGQAPREIFRRALRPLTVPSDQGPQSATLALPSLERGDQLVLRTTAGPTGNISWGWAYLARVNLE